MPASRICFFTVIVLAATTAAASAAGPDDPIAPVPADRYRSVTAGTKSYRPVEPLPWGDVNRRVTPSGAERGASPRSQNSGVAPQTAPQHKH